MCLSSDTHTFLEDASIEYGNVKAPPGRKVALEGCLLCCITLHIALDCNGFLFFCCDGLHLQIIAQISERVVMADMTCPMEGLLLHLCSEGSWLGHKHEKRD